MKTNSIAIAAMSFAASLSALAETRTWTGNGDGVTLSQSANWEGGVAPSSGERISIPSGKTVSVTAAANANLLVSLAGADIGGTLEIANYAATVTLPSTFTLAGSGEFRVLSVNQIEIKGDNSDFTGSFFTSNTIFKVQHNRALGITCPVTHCVTTTDKKMIVEAGGIYSNPVTLRQTGTGTTYFSYKSTANVTNNGDFALYAYSNASCNRFEGAQDKTLVFLGDVVLHKGYLDCTGNVHFNGSGRTDTSDSGFIMCDSGSLTIGRTLDPATVKYVRATGAGKVTFSLANALNGCKVHLHSTTPQLDLNGLDQTMGDLDDTSTLGGATIHSASPATLTMTGKATNNRYGGGFTGAVSFTFDSAGNAITLTNNPAKPSTTTGSLTAKAGTIALGNTAKFTALGEIVLDGGDISVAAGATVNAAANLRVTSNGGTLSLAENEELTVQTARVNGGFAPADVYTYASPGPFEGILQGGGLLRVVSDLAPIDDSPVFTWVGGSDTSLSNPLNWEGGEAPAFGGTETIVFKENNGTANLSGTIKVYALKFDGSGTFNLTGDANAMVDVAYDGVTVTNSASAAAFAVTIAPSLRVLTDQTWVVPINHSLTLSSELRAASALTTANMVTGIGGGQLHLLADNSAFLPRFDFKKNFSVRTNNGKGLGSPSRTVSCVGKMPYFYGGKALTNDVPLVLAGISYSNNADQINADDTPLVQRGHITLADSSAATRYIAFYASGSMEGGVTSPNAVNTLWLRAMSDDVRVKIEKEPIEDIGMLIPDQAGSFDISCTNNSFGALRANKTFVRCLAEGVMPSAAVLRFGQPNIAPSYSPKWGWWCGAVDLCGCNQTVHSMETSGKIFGEQEAQGVVTSGAPASVVVTGVHTNDNLVLRFLGAAGCTLDAPGALMALSNGVSATSGDLRVSNGEMRLDAGFVWGGSNTVTVVGGMLKVTDGAASNAFGGDASLTRMYLSGDGKLDIPSGTVVTVHGLYVDGDGTVAGSYSGANGNADKRYASYFGPGAGTLRVRRSTVAGTCIIFR